MRLIEEDHLRSDYVRRVSGKSRIVPGRVIDEREYMVCPRCEVEQSPIDHGETRTCACGLQMECWGNLLRLRFRVAEPGDEKQGDDSLPLHADLLTALGYIEGGEEPPPIIWHPEEAP